MKSPFDQVLSPYEQGAKVQYRRGDGSLFEGYVAKYVDGVLVMVALDSERIVHQPGANPGRVEVLEPSPFPGRGESELYFWLRCWRKRYVNAADARPLTDEEFLRYVRLSSNHGNDFDIVDIRAFLARKADIAKMDAIHASMPQGDARRMIASWDF